MSRRSDRGNERHSVLGIVVVLCAFSAGCGTADSGVTFPDGSATLLDGSVALPDAALSSPDAALSSPDAAETGRGSVALGQPCRGYDECAPLSGKVVECYCDTQ